MTTPARLPRCQRVLLSTLSGAVVLGIWWLVAALGIWSELIVPTPSAVWDALIESVTVTNGRNGLSNYFLWEHLWASLWRILNGVFWAVVIGIPLGLLLSLSRRVAGIVEPWVNVLRSLPPLAYFSLLIIWFGIGDTSKIWLLFLAAFPPITLATIGGVQQVRPDRVDAALSLGASRPQVIRHTVMPSILPDLFVGLRLAVGFAWTTIVAAETSNGIPGIGGLAWSTKNQLRTDVAILCVIVIGATALALDALIKKIGQALVPWQAGT